MKKLLALLLIVSCQLFIDNCSAQSVSATLIANVTCHGQSNGSVTCTPSGGTTPYTYLWSPGSQTTQTATGLTAATYTITLHDHLAHTASASVIVSQPAALSVTASAKFSSVCPGSSDSLYCSGVGGTIPYNYLWTAPYDDISCPTCGYTNSYPYGAPYIITAISDLNGCTASASVSVTVYPFPYVTISGPINPIAPGRADTLIAHATGATSYAWSNSSTASAIRVTPSISTTYSVMVHNIFGCLDTVRYTIDTNSVGNGTSSSNAIRIAPSTTLNMASFSTKDSVAWFKFLAADSNSQIIANSPYLGMPVPHVHRLTLYNNSLQMLVDEPMPDIIGANQIRIDISHLHIGSTYYVRASRCPAHANMAGCNPSASGECNASQRWDFQMGFRTVPVFVPDDSSHEAPAVSQLYYEHRGQIPDLNNIPRFDIKAYTNNSSPAVFASDSAVSFVYRSTSSIQRVDMVLTGTNVQPSQPVFKMEEDSNAGYLNYFLGYVPNGVPQIEGYSRLVYKNIYPNLDMHIYSNTVGTKLYFVCNPGGTGGGGNPANIELQFKGASSVTVNGSGGLDVVTALGTLTFAPGFAYTDSAGMVKHKSWQAYFIVVNSNTVRFNTGSYNTNEPLVIEVDRGHKVTPNYSPIDNLDWSTYFGGSDAEDQFNDVCSDAAGNVYATGYTSSEFYPVTPGAVQDTLLSARSATLAKFDSLDKKKWATYYGGEGQGDGAYGVALDASGDVYITGFTQATNLPLASRPSSPNNYVQSSIVTNIVPGGINAFIAMFSNDGKKTYWATYYGGAGTETGRHIVIDGNSNVYVVGEGVSSALNSYFPIQNSSHAGAYNNSRYGTSFILEFNASQAFDANVGITREWATRIGDSLRTGISTTVLYGCAVDASTNFYVTGFANWYGYTSPAPLTFPYTYGGINAVVTKFNSNNNIDWSTYYGGNGSGGSGEDARAITVDQSRNVYITGNSTSDSSNGIGIQTKKLGSGFFQRSNPTNSDGYVAEFDSIGRLKWGTYFGGSGNLAGQAITTDIYHNLYVTGWDNATNMPLPGSNPAGVYNQTSFVSGQTTYDGFVASFSNAGTNPKYVWGTYFGNNEPEGICITHYTGHNWLYIAGNIGNGNTPLVFPAGSWQEDTFYYNALNATGTSFISQFDVNSAVFTGINNISSSPDGILVYPNPTAQNITLQINLPENENVKISLISLLGETVFTENMGTKQGLFQKQISLASLPDATYILKTETKDKVYYNKILKLQ